MISKYVFLGFVVATVLVGCASGSDQVYLPDVQSEGTIPQTVFVPALKSDEIEERLLNQDLAVTPDPTVAPESTVPARGAEPGTADADVIFVEARLVQDDTWTFSVTVAHADIGWEDYADGWDVVLADGTVLKPDPESPFTRLLLHPHVDEQPFTRSQGNIMIPVEIESVIVRAHDLIDGFGGQEIKVDLTADSGPGFEVQHN